MYDIDAKYKRILTTVCAVGSD